MEVKGVHDVTGAIKALLCTASLWSKVEAQVPELNPGAEITIEQNACGRLRLPHRLSPWETQPLVVN